MHSVCLCNCRPMPRHTREADLADLHTFTQSEITSVKLHEGLCLLLFHSVCSGISDTKRTDRTYTQLASVWKLKEKSHACLRREQASLTNLCSHLAYSHQAGYGICSLLLIDVHPSLQMLLHMIHLMEHMNVIVCKVCLLAFCCMNGCLDTFHLHPNLCHLSQCDRCHLGGPTCATTALPWDHSIVKASEIKGEASWLDVTLRTHCKAALCTLGTWHVIDCVLITNNCPAGHCTNGFANASQETYQNKGCHV